jgi:formylglycine-generating enzyme
LQSFAVEANLVAVQRAANLFPLLLATVTGLTGLGCATTELALPGMAAAPPEPAPQGLLASLGTRGAVSAPVAVAAPGLREAASSRADTAAYLALRVSPVTDAEDRSAAILAADARCPAEMALVDGRACVDRWEASILERVPGGGERPWSPYLPIDGHESHVRAVSRPGVIPQGYISGTQAAGACTASGKRLCGADEWEHACRGPAGTTFPYGDVRRAGVCNDDIRPVHPVAEAGKILGIPGDRLWRDGMNQSLVNQLPDTLLPTGERAECTNAYGVYDMVGNLHEWIDDPDGTFRGGYYMDTTKNGDGCNYQTTAHDFTYHDYSTGFRCCMDPEQVE